MSTQLFNSEYFNKYLELVEDTESPRIFHIWSLASCLSAAMGRRVWIPFGVDNIYPNLFTVLVGPPAARKSTALKIPSRLLRKYTGVRFAPSDTGGQRQGLISALENEQDEEVEQLKQDMELAGGMTAEALGDSTVQLNINPEDKHVMFAVASELKSFVGVNADSMLTFLQCVYDGDDYDYKLKKEGQILERPLLSCLAATTPTDIKTCFREESIGQGFMSRIVFVYGSQKHKSVPRPKAFNSDLEAQIGERMGHIFYKFHGPVKEAEGVGRFIDAQYETDIGLTDVRFVYYSQRRQTHLYKLAMAFMAGRGEMTMRMEDVEDALTLLTVTEKFMPEALGEFGQSYLSIVKQKLVEMITFSKEPIKIETLFTMFHREIKSSDFQICIIDLVNANKIMQVELGDGTQAVVSKIAKREQEAKEDFMDLVSAAGR